MNAYMTFYAALTQVRCFACHPQSQVRSEGIILGFVVKDWWIENCAMYCEFASNRRKFTAAPIRTDWETDGRGAHVC